MKTPSLPVEAGSAAPEFVTAMVEAGGIEPPSEGLPATATTRLVRGF